MLMTRNISLMETARKTCQFSLQNCTKNVPGLHGNSFSSSMYICKSFLKYSQYDGFFPNSEQSLVIKSTYLANTVT